MSLGFYLNLAPDLRIDIIIEDIHHPYRFANKRQAINDILQYLQKKNQLFRVDEENMEAIIRIKEVKKLRYGSLLIPSRDKDDYLPMYPSRQETREEEEQEQEQEEDQKQEEKEESAKLRDEEKQ